MDLTVRLDGTLLKRREEEWAHWLAHPQDNPLVPDADGHLSAHPERLNLQNELCIYSALEPEFAEGLPYSGIIVTRRRCESVFDLTPAEVAATHTLLGQVRAHLAATVQPDGYTVGWNVFPAAGAHVPQVHLHVIPRWNTDVSAGAGLRYFLKVAAQAARADL
ncbi:HIT family protein [Deinococcus radiophilus]|uniref:HIT domain-containing protein n=1 Tax=Deinococcus radiophilus TaxID=32062 RepID=A0A431VKE4_9DEIO|nr:HIT domain-containing protein [Deinococcus radiophilus]RTR22839.1 HIT domain-containing protein [Deinococcus radiophilus]UFA50547.1 HIT domain-containing protein [Deinococcus radiophilus]